MQSKQACWVPSLLQIVPDRLDKVHTCFFPPTCRAGLINPLT